MALHEAGPASFSRLSSSPSSRAVLPFTGFLCPLGCFALSSLGDPRTWPSLPAILHCSTSMLSAHLRSSPISVLISGFLSPAYTSDHDPEVLFLKTLWLTPPAPAQLVGLPVCSLEPCYWAPRGLLTFPVLFPLSDRKLHVENSPAQRPILIPCFCFAHNDSQ